VRTTWNIDEDVLEELRPFARGRGMTLGEAASSLLRRALRQPLGVRHEGGAGRGLCVFDAGEETEVVSIEETLRLEDCL
jgi:hypothetical protein